MTKTGEMIRHELARHEYSLISFPKARLYLSSSKSTHRVCVLVFIFRTPILTRFTSRSLSSQTRPLRAIIVLSNTRMTAATAITKATSTVVAIALEMTHLNQGPRGKRMAKSKTITTVQIYIQIQVPTKPLTKPTTTRELRCLSSGRSVKRE